MTQAAPHVAERVGLIQLAVAVMQRVCRLTPTTLVSIGIGLNVFSGDWKYMHVPVPLDRAFEVLGLVVLVVGGARAYSQRRVTLRPVHFVLLAVAAGSTASAIWAHQLTDHQGLYALLDRLGIVPILLFTLAPILYGTAKQRSRLLVVLVIVGGYLGITALLEGVGLTHLVFPSFIVNPALGTHSGRARGPFLEASANGLSLYICSAAAAVAFVTWREWWARAAAGVISVVCLVGVVFTLTRSQWIAACVGTVVALGSSRRARRYLPAILAGASVVVVVLFIAVSGLSTKARNRASDSLPVWNRYNTNHAAIRVVEQHPLFGIGWNMFPVHGTPYLRQAGTYPMVDVFDAKGLGLGVHNVFLSQAAELGLPLALLWTFAFFCAVGGAVFRRGPPELEPWKSALVAVAIAFLITANLVPLTYAFPNVIIWLLAGVISADFYSEPRACEPEAAPVPAPVGRNGSTADHLVGRRF